MGSQTIASFLGYPQLVTDQKWSTKAHLSYPNFTFRTPLQGQLSLPLRLYHNCSNFSSTSSTSFSSLLQVLIPKSCHKTPLVDRHGSRDTTFCLTVILPNLHMSFDTGDTCLLEIVSTLAAMTPHSLCYFVPNLQSHFIAKLFPLGP